MIYTFFFATLLIAALVLLVFGNRLYDWIMLQLPILKDFVFLIMSLRSLGTIIILSLFFLLLAFSMLWLYFCMYILFVGAEINVFLSNGKDT